jgi:hypothetical protein
VGVLRDFCRLIEDYPNPDLAITIGISRSKIDRAGIYAALKVPELWRFHKDGIGIPIK